MRELVKNIGKRLSRIRKEKLLTLKDMAAYTGYSVGFFSNLEKGKTSPTIEQLDRISQALQIDFVDLVTEEKTLALVVRYDHLPSRAYVGGTQVIETIDFGYDHNKYEILTIAGNAGKSHEKHMHSFPEIGIVMEGTLTVEIEGEVFVLNRFDSIYIPMNRIHRTWNDTADPVVSYWVRQAQ